MTDTSNAADTTNATALATPAPTRGAVVITPEGPAPRADRIVVRSEIAVFDTGVFDHLYRVATIMAQSPLLPKHLRGGTVQESAANCFRIVEFAHRVRVSPFALMDGTFPAPGGKIGFEGKVVAALLNISGILDGGRLEFEYTGTPGKDDYGIKATGSIGGKVQTLTGTVGEWKTANEKWKTMPGQMLVYRASAWWTRRYAPEIILGVYIEDELDGMTDAGSGRTEAAERATPAIQAPVTPPTEAFELFDTTGKRIDLISSGDAFAKRLAAIMSAVRDKETGDALWQFNADGIARIEESGSAEAKALLGMK